ncbi:MAG: phage tail tube protein [Kangiella sp.]|nr:phage tail tube protein [Kangiella sp.]MCW9029668.1 phage tail tube protein [Kangiella sp.]
MNFKSKILMGILEPTYGDGMAGVDAVSANALPMQNVSIKALEGELVGRELVSHDLGNDKQYLVGKHVSIEGELPFFASGDLGVAPPTSLLHRIAGLSEVITAATSVEYQFVNDDFESAAMWFMQNSVAHKLKGVRGNLALTVKAGAFPVMKVNLMGLYDGIATETPPNVDWSALADPIEVSVDKTPTFTLHGQALVMDNLEIDFGNAVNYRNKVNYEAVSITDRSLTGKTDVDAVDLGTKNYYSSVINGEAGPLVLTHGTEAGSIIEITHDLVQIQPFEYQDLEGETAWSMPLRFLKGGNFKITYK